MSSNAAEISNEPTVASNPLDVIPNEIPFDVPYGRPISLEQAQAVIHAAVAEARKRDWKLNVAVADSGENLVAFQRMDGAMLASIQIAQHKARAAVAFRRPTKVFEDGVNLMHLNYLLAFDGVIASRGGIPLIEQGEIIGAIGCSASVPLLLPAQLSPGLLQVWREQSSREGSVHWVRDCSASAFPKIAS